MKKLLRMRLINWHRFTDCTISFGDSTLVSGENGAGKSTLLDAIQFVITCSANAFNKAAHENGKRKLTGYIRCKTGKENKPYERTGPVSAHIALEFYEESRKKYFIIGAAVDSASEGQEATVRYLIDNARLSDEMFLKGRQIRSISEFRAANKGVRQWCKTQTEAKKMIQARLGRIEDKFFRLIPKALAFRPIDDIKDFVYSYVLDEKDVNIDVLRENVRTYQDLERTLESVKRRMAKLEEISRQYENVTACIEKNDMYEYFLARADVDIIRKQILEAKNKLSENAYRLAEKEQSLKGLAEERDRKQEMETALRVELKQNQDFLALEEQKKEQSRLEAEEKVYIQEKRDLKRSAGKSGKQAGQILEALQAAQMQSVQMADIPDMGLCIEEYAQMLGDLDKITDIAGARALTERVIGCKRELYKTLQTRQAEIRLLSDKLKDERAALDQRISKLERKKLSYPPAVERVSEAVSEEFSRIGRKQEPRVLCELLEIEDESWRNAVEGYLNTQRFYVLVEPEDFDIALGTYDRLRREKKAYGAGLINTQRMEAYDTAPDGTLATVVSSKNRYAKRFANMILGKVQMCARYDELKKYPTSITKECMKYQNRVAAAIKPEIFQVPFIGRNAFKVQLEQAKEERKTVSQAIAEKEKELHSIEGLLEPLSTDYDIDVKYHLEVLGKLAKIKVAIKAFRDSIRTLEKNSTLIQKQIQLDMLTKLRKEVEGKIDAHNQEIGGLRARIQRKKEDIERMKAEEGGLREKLSEIAGKAGDALGGWQKEYEKQTKTKSYEQFRENYERRQKANETTRRNAEAEMANRMVEYKTEYDFGAAASMEGFPEFAAVYDRLRTSELLDYEEKVQSARTAAEDEFREQFLSKLQENMKQAQAEFKELNRALKGITFSNERYEFLYMPSKKYRSYYEMIMSDFNAIQGESIFSGIFHETHKEVIEELFERLAMNGSDSAKTLDEFTDYRTYMDYDIKILHSDDSFSYYSKVCEEKSGGETQTPFYVTVAASFVQLYGNNIGGESAGLVMFDEAFNNMDDERIGGVLKFLRRLPLQIIIAAPPDKIQYISPEMEETLLVMTDEKVSYAEEYHNAGL